MTTVQIRLVKLTGDRHRLEIVRADGTREGAELETRSYLVHDFWHLAVESEARLDTGFWGYLAGGKTLADMNDRTKPSMKEYSADMAAIERVIGGLTPAAKGADASAVLAGLGAWAAAEGSTLPAWLDRSFVTRAQGRMRHLLGQWRATRHGASMTISWP